MALKYKDDVVFSEKMKSDIQEMLGNQKFNHFIFEATTTDEGMCVKLQNNLKCKEDVQNWITDFECSTKTTYSIEKTVPTTGKMVLYKVFYKCHHNTRNVNKYSDAKPRCKNTKCPAKIKIIVRSIPKRVRSNSVMFDIINREYPCIITIKYWHNHAINSADSLRFRRVTQETKEKLLYLFRNGHSPSTALQSLQVDIQMNEQADVLLADRSVCPDLSYCYRLYYNIFEKEYAPPDIKSPQTYLNEKICKYNEECGTICAKISGSEQNYVIAICTPLMKRVHESVDQTGEVIFMDSTASVDKNGHKIFLLLTYNETGGLPVGVLITCGKSTEIITAALNLYKTLLVENCFYGRGILGPCVFVTDNSDFERIAIQNIWPNSIKLLCTFRLLQSVWRFIMKASNNIKSVHRQDLYCAFKNVVYSESENVCRNNYGIVIDLGKEYPNFLSYMSSLWNKRVEWTPISAKTLIRGINSNNYIEAAVKILKDDVFERVSSFNLLQLVDYITTTMESYYSTKLLNFAMNRSIEHKRIVNENWKNPASTIIGNIKLTSNKMYIVPSQSKKEILHTVDTDIGCCTCQYGTTGKFCKHQYWVTLRPENATNSATHLHNLKKICYYLAIGSEPQDQWIQTQHCEAILEKYTASIEQVVSGANTENEQGKGVVKNESEDILTKNLDQLMETIRSKFKDSEEVAKGLAAMTRKVAAVTSPTAMVSALTNFGKEPSTKRKCSDISKPTTAKTKRKPALRVRVPLKRPKKDKDAKQNGET